MENQIQEINTTLEVLKIIIPSVITAIGFIINILITKSSINKEVKKKKMDINLEKLENVPFEILTLIDHMLKDAKQHSALEEFKQLSFKIFAYGSENAIKIISSMQQYNYNIKNNNGEEHYNVMCYYIILCCQIKYDLTGVKICPNEWYKLKITDYHTTKDKIKVYNNKIIEELKLDKFLLIH